MSKEKIKNLLIEFVCEYDFTSWSNDKVYEKFSDLIYKQISDLETKLAEKDKAIENLRIDLKDYQDLEEKISTKYDKVVEKLAEKEKLIEDYSAFFNQLFNQDKISFAIAELEKVKELVEEKGVISSPFGNLKIQASDVSVIIDNQIKQLKEIE